MPAGRPEVILTSLDKSALATLLLFITLTIDRSWYQNRLFRDSDGLRSASRPLLILIHNILLSRHAESFTALTPRKRPTGYLYSACFDDTQRLVTVN